MDIILEAHEHDYERLWPVYNETVTSKDYVNPKAPIHIISGTAGCNEADGLCFDVMLGPRGNFHWLHFQLHDKCRTTARQTSVRIYLYVTCFHKSPRRIEQHFGYVKLVVNMNLELMQICLCVHKFQIPLSFFSFSLCL